MGATEIAEFGFPGRLRDALVNAILRGDKTATTGLLEVYRRHGTRVEAVGGRALVVDSAGRGIAVIETTAVEVKRLGDVDLAFARDEGEGYETLAQWRDAHVGYFTSPEMVAALGHRPVAIDDDTLVVCSRFRVVERVGPEQVRASICVAVDEPDEVRAVEAWLEQWGSRLSYRSENQGCGCCVDLWDVLGPEDAIGAIPHAIRAASGWADDG